MIKKILIVIGILLLLFLAFVYTRLQPSGDINEYQSHFTDDQTAPDSNAVKVTFFGATTLLFDDGETQLLIDGFFSRPTMFRVLTTSIQSDTALIDRVMAQSDMNRVKGIFVAHSHYDHSFDVAYTTKKTGATLYGSPSTLNIARGGNVAESQLSAYQPGQSLTIGGFTVRVLRSKHSPGNAQSDDGVSIDSLLKQPAKYKSYTEGGSFDFLISHHGKNIYVKPSPNYIESALDSIRADALFLGIGIVTKQTPEWQNAYYNETIGKLKPSVVVPIHWDDFFYPASENLQMLPRFVSKGADEFNFFIEKTRADNIDFKILQGTKSILIR